MIHEKHSSRIHRWDGAGRGRSRVVHNSDTDFPVDLGSRRGGAPAPCSPLRRESMGEPQGDITRLLRAAASGDRRDLDALMAAIYDDLRRLAMSHMRSERGDHTLQPTALANEAYVKLIGQHQTDWKDRLHFFAIASRVIRRILIDHAREKLAAKRGGSGDRVRVDEQDVPSPEQDVDLLALDEAMSELAEIDERQAKIVELRFFGGCSIDEIAEILDIGKRSVDREWQAARAWLFCRLSDGPAGAGHG
jgi:RNA polymerase sigma-70 factor (ECF subfamily)